MHVTNVLHEQLATIAAINATAGDHKLALWHVATRDLSYLRLFPTLLDLYICELKQVRQQHTDVILGIFIALQSKEKVHFVTQMSIWN